MNIAYTYGNALPVRWSTPRIRGPGNHILACHRIPVRALLAYDGNGILDRDSPKNILPLHFVERLEHDQTLTHCCRHPENHDIVAWFSCDAEEDKGLPDLYIFHCTCGKEHRRLMCTEGSARPFWESR